MKHRNLAVFAAAALLTTVIGTTVYIYEIPPLIYGGWEQGIIKTGIGGGPIPVNTLYTEPGLPDPATTNANALTAGANRDTLYTIGVLDLSTGPEVLSVPDMAGRYYVVQLVDSRGDDFASVGSRTTGTEAGSLVVSGPGWHGTIPHGLTQIASPDDRVLVIGRTLVESDSDLATVHRLATQIRLTPLNRWQPGAGS
jgi:hypothetical protein